MVSWGLKIATNILNHLSEKTFELQNYYLRSIASKHDLHVCGFFFLRMKSKLTLISEVGGLTGQDKYQRDFDL